MKTKRSTQRRLTLEDWLALPHIGRRDMILRAECELLACHRLCASKQCRRHRACCADDALACERSLWHRAGLHAGTLRRELARLYDLAKLPGPELPGPRRKIRKDTSQRRFWAAGLDGPWNAPANPPLNLQWAPAAAPVPAHRGQMALDRAVRDIIGIVRPENFGGEGG